MRRVLVLIIVILIFSFPLYSKEKIQSHEFSFPQISTYMIGFSAFVGTGLSTENEYLLKSLPLLFIEGLDLLQTHTLSDEQKMEYRKSLIRLEIINQNKKLKDIRTTLDKLLFEKKTKAELKKERTKKKQDYDKILRIISELKSLDPETAVDMPDELDIEIKQGADGILLNPPSFSPLQYVIDNNIDLLFFGTLEEIYGYLYIEVNGFDRILEKNVFYYKDIIAPEDIYELIPDLRNKFIKTILGRDWTSLKINASPENAYVYVNDEFAGIGSTLVNYIKPGLTSIKVTHPDYFEQQWMAELQPYEEKEFEITLEKMDLGIVHLASLPSNALVYINSVYSGVTPLDIDKSLALKRILIKKEDFDDYILHIDYTSKNNILAELYKSDMSPEEKQRRKRDKFYVSLGFWLVSIPVPIFLNEFSNDFADVSFNMYYSETLRDQYKLMSNVFSAAYWTTFAISGGLFINMGINLIDYIKAADRPIG